MKARRYHLLSMLARKREVRTAQERRVSAATSIILHAARSQGLYGQRSNTVMNVDGLTRRVAPIDAALGRERRG